MGVHWEKKGLHYLAGCYQCQKEKCQFNHPVASGGSKDKHSTSTIFGVDLYKCNSNQEEVYSGSH